MYRIEVTVHVKVAVEHLERGVFCHLWCLDSRYILYGALFLRVYVVFYLAVMDGKNVLRLTCVGVYHCPNALGIAIDGFVVLRHDGPVTFGEELHGILHPCLNIEFIMLLWNTFKLNRKSGEYPCLVLSPKVCHTKAALSGVHVRGVEQVVAEMTYAQLLCKVAVKGIGRGMV